MWAHRLADARAAVDEGFEVASSETVPDPGLAWLAALGLRAEADAAEAARARHDASALEVAMGRARRIMERLPPPERVPDAAWGGRGRAILALCGAELAPGLTGPTGGPGGVG